MPAYVVSRLTIHDRAAFESYLAEAPRTVARFRGKYLFRGKDVTALEGGWADERLVILEFGCPVTSSLGLAVPEGRARSSAFGLQPSRASRRSRLRRRERLSGLDRRTEGRPPPHQSRRTGCQRAPGET